MSVIQFPDDVSIRALMLRLEMSEARIRALEVEKDLASKELKSLKAHVELRSVPKSRTTHAKNEFPGRANEERSEASTGVSAQVPEAPERNEMKLLEALHEGTSEPSAPSLSRTSAGAQPRFVGEQLCFIAPSETCQGKNIRRRKRRDKNELDSSRHHALADRLTAAFAEVRGTKYGFDGPRDGKGLRQLLSFGETDEEIERRWRWGLQRQSYPCIGSIGELARHWNVVTGREETKKRDPRRGTVWANDQDHSGPSGFLDPKDF